MQCDKLNGFPIFPDGRMICPDTLPQNMQPNNIYNIICKCDKHPEGCIKQISVFTDAIEAVRDNFWGASCKSEHITIIVDKVK